jgi:hypothetical protein
MKKAVIPDSFFYGRRFRELRQGAEHVAAVGLHSVVKVSLH